MSGEKIVFYRHGEWTGVYVDGELERAGDHYRADEWLQDRMGVKVVDSDAWIPDGRTALTTLELVDAEAQRREELAQAAKAKREMAAELIAEADALEKRIKNP